MDTRNDEIARILYRLCAGEFISQTFDNPLQGALNEAEIMGLIQNEQGTYSLTKEGNILVKSGKTYEQYLQEQNNSTAKIHVENSQNTVIGNQNTQSFSARDLANNSPTSIPKKKTIKYKNIGIAKWVWSVIGAILASAIIYWLTKK